MYFFGGLGVRYFEVFFVYVYEPRYAPLFFWEVSTPSIIIIIGQNNNFIPEILFFLDDDD